MLNRGEVLVSIYIYGVFFCTSNHGKLRLKYLHWSICTVTGLPKTGYFTCLSLNLGVIKGRSSSSNLPPKYSFYCLLSRRSGWESIEFCQIFAFHWSSLIYFLSSFLFTNFFHRVCPSLSQRYTCLYMHY